MNAAGHWTRDIGRILFVSSTMGGGSGRSQRELDAAVRAQGIDTMMLVDDGGGNHVSRFLHEQFLDASVRFSDTPLLASSSQWLRSLPGRRARHLDTPEAEVMVSLAPENAFPDIALDFRPDVVVGSSIARPTWLAIRNACRHLGIATALYLREATALEHLRRSDGRDLVIANSHSLVAAASELGVSAAFVPSIVDLSGAIVTPSRDVVMLVNPREAHGVGLISELATTFPTIPFVLQESWPLDAEEQLVVSQLLAAHPNVTFRHFKSEPGAIYADVAVLLAPHLMDNRPRTILEAQASGIPVIATALPGLAESVGDGGVCIPLDADVVEWTDALDEIWRDPSRYSELERAARAHAARSEVDPQTIVDDFIELLSDHRRIVEL